jgi:hypothetical protein
MSRFKTLEDFERRFEAMNVDELSKWKKYWTRHAQAMKRVYDIDKAIERKSQPDAE